MTLTCSLAGILLAKLPYANLIGALVLALLLGILMQFLPERTRQEASGGMGFISNKFLRLGMILLGFRLDLEKLAAAVMGVSPQITAADEARKRENEVLAVAVVCVMGTVFTLLEIGLKPVLGLTDSQFGIVAGGSLHEIAHAVASGGAFGNISLDSALIMKLSRVILLAPVALIIGYLYQRRSAKTNTGNVEKAQKNGKLPIPWFLGGFILTSILGTYLPFSASSLDALVQVAYIFLGMAMAALGVSVNFKVIFKRGGSVFGAAAISSTCLLVFMIIMSKLFF
ncbi:putative sulfate exporter family transporter [Lactobacillus amylovorus]|uniref:Sulfate exporter family transporter n=1 Tax=Lactobacillus amylovorus TaxID=1604 RepID=A0AAW6B7S1_LACAM|nr:putative sulfate exporter family transporter [Lactobacillus amylovorus]MDA6088927.1 putative sulfate exporter family transporter [Lactobacillus amylovorus]MDB6221971.1 putative sulfate exporter family transporter [Lactobacillus amylovorus]MDB6239309.1 putative sulfate exporter family transporter [Lactobacillus amylovorus]MDB6246201.1 putative sulfate exporter family transporter [Lactobacillus amylovorus]